jgi:putative spermidine/putrescine transport system substrate-binding protein
MLNYQLSRRSFIRVSTAITLAQLLGSCSSSENILQILFLANSIPIQLIGDFRKVIKPTRKVDFQPQIQLEQIFDLLDNLSQQKAADSQSKSLLDKILNRAKKYPSITSLGDSWLASAIEQNLIQPLETKNLANWQKLPSSWQKLVRRNNQGNITNDGEIYGAPYRWGTTVIAYQSDKLNELGLTITDWEDLWNPQLSDRLSLLDSPREIIGLTLKKLGYSYNTDNLNSIPNLEAELLALHRQAKLYSSDHYLEPLVLGDTWVAVGWSTDILSAIKRYPEIKFIIPRSGTSLWADLWVKPRLDAALTVKDQDLETAIDRWIDFCWESKAAKQISLFTDGLSPLLLAMKPTDLPQDLQDNVLLNSAILKSEQSEFLLSQTPETMQQYQDLWLKIRQSKEEEGMKNEG